VNAGFVTGLDTTLIIDTGANALAAATIQGYASAVRPSNRLLVLNTEKHFDHIGGNGYFRGQGIDVYGHSLIQRTAAEFRSELAEFNAAIPPGARRALGEEQVFYFATSLANPNRPISEDTELELGDCTVQLLLTPGHTPTNVSVYVPGDRVVYCGDCLTHRYLPNLDLGSPLDWQQWLQSLDRIAALNPSAIVPGHGPVATGDDVPRLIDTMRGILTQAIATGRTPTSPGG
jgi:glyoxylase-like metal-dependent hydrolase (beta-lactamase superfamily II)